MNPFEKLIFLLGCIVLAIFAFVVFLAIVAIAALAIDEIGKGIREREAREKLVASQPIDHIDLTYDCEGWIKRGGDELRKLTGGERRK